MKILAIDLGLARTGLAVSDDNQILASPLCVIFEKDRELLIKKIFQICIEKKIEKIIIGLPRNMDGSEGNSAQNAKVFASNLNALTNLPIEMIDERGTTITAKNFLNETNVRGKKRKNVIDAVAATIILQNYLDSCKSNLGT